MAQYLTTGEELISIADAIRTKTGENLPLVYPNGFITAIGNLTKYDWKGKDAELVDTIYDDAIILSDTDLSTWTPSSTVKTVFDGTSISTNSVTVNSDYDYVVVTDVCINLQYVGTAPNPHIIESYGSAFAYIGARPYTYTDYINDTNSTHTYDSAVTHWLIIADNSTGDKIITANTYGIFITVNSPSVSKTNYPTMSISTKLPNLRVGTSGTYMTSAAFNALDLSNSKMHIWIRVFRTAHDNLFNGAWAHFRAMGDKIHNVT